MAIENEFAQFRLREFRDFPYLYSGTLEKECAYLEAYAANPNSMPP